MEEEVKYCKNCKRDINAKNYVIHSAHCERKIQLCGRCSEPVPRTELEKHEEEFHSQVDCPDCGISIEKWQIEKHKETCAKKLISCEYCELDVTLDDLSEHIAACGSRTEQCPKCKKHVMLKDLEKHPTKCLRREPEAMPCEYCDCQIDFNEYERHIAMCGTRTERCFLCNQHVMVQDRDTHFVTCGKALNFNESISCDYCGGSYSHNSIQRHVEICRIQTEKCDRCNNYIQRNDMALHLTMCEQKQQLRLNFPCKYCGELFLSDFLEDHVALCGSRRQRCEKCDYYIDLKNMETHSNVCKENSDAFKYGIPCKYCGDLFLHNVLEHHVSMCRLRTEECRKCGKSICLNEMEKHQWVHEKSMSRTHGNCAVCHQPVLWMEMNVHTAYCAQTYYETNDYDRQNQLNERALMKDSGASAEKSTEEKKPQLEERKKNCTFCFEHFPYSRFSQHLEVCQERPYQCGACLKPMRYREKEKHVSSCRIPRTERHYTKEYMVHDEEMDGTKELKKLKKCQFCDNRFTDVLFQHHVKECEHREEMCDLCSENVPIKDMHEHRLLKCNFVRFAGKKTSIDHNSVLSEAIVRPSKNFDSENHLEKNVEVCPSCRCKIPEERYNKHLHLCYEGRTRCRFCGREIRKDSEHEHFRNCEGILKMVEEDKNSQGKKKKGEKNEGKSYGKSFIENFTSWISNKGRSVENNNTKETSFGKYSSRQANSGQSYERGNKTPVRPPTTVFAEVNELPCEFCNEMWPFELIIEHQSGCRPDLVSFPEAREDQKFAACASTVSQISRTPVLGASPKSTSEEDNEWKVQSRRNKPASSRENMDCKMKEGNVPQKQQLSTKEKFFYYPSQDSDEVPKHQSDSSKKKRYPQQRKSPEISKKQYSQLRKSPEISKKQYPQLSESLEKTKRRDTQWRKNPETSKTTPDKEIVASSEGKNDEPKKDPFTSFKFSTSAYNEASQHDLISWKENDGALSTDAKIHDEALKRNTCNLAEESYSGIDYVKPRFDKEIKAVGAERTERKRILHSRKDVDADLSLVSKDFEEISLLKSITFNENKRNEPSTILETAESALKINMPANWNSEYDLYSDKTYKSSLSKSFSSNYGNKAKDDTHSNAVESNEHSVLNMQDADYDKKNEETFGNDFMAFINSNRNKEDEIENISNSSDIFYDADDGGAKFVNIVNDNVRCISNTQEEKSSHFALDNLNLSNRHQKENLSYSNYGNLNVGVRQEEEDLNPKDSDFNAYYQFLFKSIEQTDEADENKIEKERKLSHGIAGNCRCGNKECCCETSIMQKKSLKAYSSKDASCRKSCSETLDVEPFVTGTKTFKQMESKKSSLEFSSKKNVDDEKWRKWRSSEIYDSE